MKKMPRTFYIHIILIWTVFRSYGNHYLSFGNLSWSRRKYKSILDYASKDAWIVTIVSTFLGILAIAVYLLLMNLNPGLTYLEKKTA
jgi:hypothetical protein